MKKQEFMECQTCRVKPGSPELCTSCLHNRSLVEKLKNDLKITVRVFMTLLTIVTLALVVAPFIGSDRLHKRIYHEGFVDGQIHQNELWLQAKSLCNI